MTVPKCPRSPLFRLSWSCQDPTTPTATLGRSLLARTVVEKSSSRTSPPSSPSIQARCPRAKISGPASSISKARTHLPCIWKVAPTSTLQSQMCSRRPKICRTRISGTREESGMVSHTRTHTSSRMLYRRVWAKSMPTRGLIWPWWVHRFTLRARHSSRRRTKGSTTLLCLTTSETVEGPSITRMTWLPSGVHPTRAHLWEAQEEHLDHCQLYMLDYPRATSKISKRRITTPMLIIDRVSLSSRDLVGEMRSQMKCNLQ
jgi:hypothetical protein